jgi:hypothetical protein
MALNDLTVGEMMRISRQWLSAKESKSTLAGLARVAPWIGDLEAATDNLVASQVTPLLLHLVRRRPAARRLQAVRVRQGHPAVHRAAPPRLRARSPPRPPCWPSTPQARRPPAQPRALPAAQVRAAGLLQHVAARPEEADGRPGPHRREPARLHPGLLARRARHLRALRLPHPDRPAGQGRAALPGHREVREHRPAPRPVSNARWAWCSRS